MNKNIFLLFLIYNIGYSIQTPQDNYYYRDNTQPSSSQGRFVPSFQQNGRSSYLDRGLRNQPAADSYQEQTLFIGNENRNQDTTPNYYSSFNPSFTTTRHSDGFEISPRPFSFGSNQNGLQYSRTPNNPNIGYGGSTRNVPARLSNTRTPLPADSSEKTSSYIGQRAGPLSSSFTPSTPYNDQRGFAFSNNRNKNTLKSSNDYFSSQEDYPNSNSNRNNKNKFRPSSTEQTAPAKTKPTRRNRFSPSSKPSTTAYTTEIPISRPNKPVYQSRRPASSEIVSNEFPSLSNSRYFVPVNTINITHNGSSKDRDSSYEENVDEVRLDENYDYVIEKKNNRNEVFDSNISTTSNKPIIKPDLEYVEFSRVVTTTAPPPESFVRNQSEENKIGDVGEHTVILTENFYLPNDKGTGDSVVSSSEYNSETSTEPSSEYEYEYEDYSEEDTEQPTTVEAVTEQITDIQPISVEEVKTERSTKVVDIDESDVSSNTEILGEQVVSVVTTKSVENSTIMDQSVEERPENLQLSPELQAAMYNDSNNSTESWVVVASVQTSRSVSGARFLPFPSVEQDEKKQTLAELEKESDEDEDGEDRPVTQNSAEITTLPLLPQTEEEDVTIIPHVVSTTAKPVLSQSTESIIDKLDRVQSELSIGLLSGKFPILQDMNENTETSTKAPPNGQPLFRKFTTQRSAGSAISDTTKRPFQVESIQDDVIAELLPPGYKSKNQGAFKNRKSTTTTASPEVENRKPARNQTNTRSFKNNVAAQDITLAGLLPKGYKPPPESDSAEQSTPPKLNELLKKINFDDNVEKLLPPGFKQQNVHPASTTTTTASPQVTKKTFGFVTISEDVDKFLPPGFKQNSYSNKKRPFPTPEGPKKFVPHGHTPTSPLPKTTTESNKPQLPALPIIPISDNIDQFLPPGYNSKEKPVQKPTVIALNEDLSISKLLPPGYKNKKEESSEEKSTEVKEPETVLSKIPFKEVASLVPPGFKLNETEIESTTVTTTTSSTTQKTVLLGKIPGLTALISHRKPGQRTTTTPKPVTSDGDHTTSGPSVTDIHIRKGPPTRVTTEFTGWPSPPTTPFSIDKLLELQKAQAIDITDLLNIPGAPGANAPSTSSTTTTTTTTTTTIRPTTPGYCRVECNLAGTIKIIDGVSWKPELLDHNTDEWQNLAREVEIQLNEVYTNDRDLSRWYKGIQIDSFSKGSVLVDYWIELVNITGEVNTLEIKRLFHDALIPSPIKKIDINESRLLENGTDSEYYETLSEPQNTRNNLLLGKFIVDPISTDFFVLPKSNNPTVGYADDDALLPQWAVAVLVIGIGSLLFVIMFGVTVIISRQNRAKKQPTPLTADMLNELNKDHMGGLESYDQEEFYNIDDAWGNGQKHNNIKPKQRFTNSMHGSSASNIYDSWRSQHRPGGGHHNNPNPQQPEYYYDDHNNYISQKNGPYPPDDYAAENHHRNAMSMYTYNPRRLTRNDYDLDF